MKRTANRPNNPMPKTVVTMSKSTEEQKGPLDFSSHAFSAKRGFYSPESQPSESIQVNAFWHELIDILPQGVLVVALNGQLLYTNSKAQNLCRSLYDSKDLTSDALPRILTDICSRSAEFEQEPLIAECFTQDQQTIRAKFQILRKAGGHPEAVILILIESCNERFKADLSIDCKKFALTEREAEIWELMQQGYTYQEVAEVLHLSLNTIKTHGKNICAKRKRYQRDEPTFWFSR
jgi:DNA-binding NarL/FixJ family response regulator